MEAARILSHVIHQEVNMETGVREQLDLEVPGENLGVWIDPIGSEIVLITV